VLLVGLASGVTHYYKGKAEAELTSVQSELSKIESQVSELRNELEARTEDPILKAKLSAAIDDVKTQQTLVAQIQSLSGLKSKAFSGLFDAFSSNNKPNLWLTSFTVNENDLTIKGELSAPTALPNWISGLTNSAYFNGQEFSDAVVERNQGSLAFELTSQRIKERQNEVIDTAVTAEDGGDNG